jgi:hypothetical protein
MHNILFATIKMQKTIVLTLLATLNLKTAHPDLHFIYPTVSTEDVKQTKSIDFIREWREFLEQNRMPAYLIGIKY